jgi:hypothetical protein
MTHESTAYERLCSELHSIAEALHSPIFQVSHRALARAIGCSASRIPAFMARLEHAGIIARDPFKNCYLIDVSPLIDQGVAVATGESIRGDRSGVIDQGVGVIDQGVGAIDQGVGVAARGDRSPLIDHPMPIRAQRQQNAASPRSAFARSHARVLEPTTTSDSESVAVANGGDARGGHAPPAAQLMAELGANPKIIRAAYTARPDWTPQHVRDRWEYDQRRIAASDGRLTAGIFFTALRSGELAPARPEPTAPIDPQAYAGRDDVMLGSDPPPPETLRDRAHKLLGPWTAENHAAQIRDSVFLQCRLGMGDSDDEALQALAEHRKAVRR